MRLYLIRHCESENNALWARTGSADGRSEDPHLTTRGERQAEVLASYLQSARERSDAPFEGGPMREGLKITHLYTSLLQRAIQTATPVSRALDLPLVAWPEIHERGGVYLSDPETGEEQGLPGPGRAFFESEYPQLLLPDAGCTQSILQTMFAVSPNGSAFSGDRFVWLKFNNGAISRIDISDDLLRLAYLNFIDYMPGKLLT
jgi:phosphohistidine phosphatase SixA